VYPRGIRKGFVALATAATLAALPAASGCGIVGNPLAGPAGPSTAPSAAASPSPSPTAAPLPEAGQCHNSVYFSQADLASEPVVDCAGSHRGETVYVGRFVGAPGELAEPPEVLSQSSKEVTAVENETYLDCAKHADQYLGHSWIHPLLYLQVSVPTVNAWAAGDRWYRCDLYQQDWNSSLVAQRSGSLKTAWFGPLCLNQNKDDWPIVDCKAKHPGEFVGGFLLPATLTKAPKTQKQFKPLYDKCWKVMAPYLGVATSRAQYIVGTSVWWQYDASMWPLGRRAAFCFTWTGKNASTYVTGSAKGRKGKGL
jgi:hypothetical protein